MVDTRPEPNTESETQIALAAPERDVTYERTQILVSSPSGDQAALPIEAKAGADMVVAFDPATADVSLVGEDLVFTFADGSQTILTNFAAAALNANVVLPDGRVLAGGVIVAELSELSQLDEALEEALEFETAGGPSVSSGGVTAYDDDMGNVIDMLNPEGTIPLTAFGQQRPEADEPAPVLQVVDAPDPAPQPVAAEPPVVEPPMVEPPAPPPPPTLSINDMTVTEGNPPQYEEGQGDDTTITFTVSRAGDLSNGSTVAYNVFAGSAGTPGDYNDSLALLTGTVTFGPGESSQTLTFDVTDDLVHEPTETFTVVLSGATDATIDDGVGVGTILDNDPAPEVSIDDITIYDSPLTKSGVSDSV